MSFRTTLVTIVALLLLTALLAACGGGAAEPTAAPAAPAAPPDPLAGWIEYAAPDGSFTLRLPEEPEVQNETVPTEAGDIEMAMYLTESDDRMVMLSHNGFPASVADLIAAGDDAFVQSLLDGGRDGAVSNVGGTLQDEKQITVAGFPGREFTFAVELRRLAHRQRDHRHRPRHPGHRPAVSVDQPDHRGRDGSCRGASVLREFSVDRQPVRPGGQLAGTRPASTTRPTTPPATA